MNTILISEWLPNPIGSDMAGEWVELWNPSGTTVDLAGWRLTADGKKFFELKGAIPPGGRLVVLRSESKITLRNSDGRLALYDPAGRLVDQASFVGSAPENKSANRSEGGISFTDPTPGLANLSASVMGLRPNIYSPGIPLNNTIHPTPTFLSFLFGTAIALTTAVMYILKTNEDLSHIFFQGNANTGRGSS